MEEIEVPSHFLCPISMQLMRDPVTISTGITYDRESIERWLISSKNNTCPVTKQILPNHADLTPNHTLHRLIQSWSYAVINNTPCDHGSKPIRTPGQSVMIDKSQMAKLINDAKKHPEMRLSSLRRIRSITHESKRGKMCFEASGGVEFLASTMAKNGFSSVEKDEVVVILNHMELSDIDLKRLVTRDNGEFVEALLNVTVWENSRSRVPAITLLQSIFKVSDPVQLMGLKSEFFVQIAEVVKDNTISQQATKAALKLLLELCPWGRNRIKAAESGLVFVLLDLILYTSERRICELVLAVLDQLCGCAEGRADLVRHGAGLAIVSKKILRVSHGTSDRAVKVLYLISRYSASPRVLQEMLQVGVVAKLCLVIQVESSTKTKERAKEILRLHSRVWKNSPCIPAHLLSSYPSC